MLRALAAFALCLFVGPAWGWSAFGHRLVGELAERQLTPATRAAVQDLLRDEPEPSLAAVAAWADEVREQRAYEWTAPLHYVNIRDRDCRYDASRDCGRGLCVVAAIRDYADRVGNPRLTRAERAEALKFLVHFVGDVHQPLHAGRRPDKGGNDFQISLRIPGKPTEGSNLHRVWDGLILADGGLRLAEYADALQSREAEPTSRATDAQAWAEHSCSLTDGEGFYPRRAGRLPNGYLQQMRPLAERRIVAAAAELARTLEVALGPPSARD